MSEGDSFSEGNDEDHSKDQSKKNSKLFQAIQTQQTRGQKCLFCKETHKPSDCINVKMASERRRVLTSKK